MEEKIYYQHFVCAILCLFLDFVFMGSHRSAMETTYIVLKITSLHFFLVGESVKEEIHLYFEVHFKEDVSE